MSEPGLGYITETPRQHEPIDQVYPTNGLPCPSPAIPLSISDSEAVRGEEERQEARKKRGGSSPLFPRALASLLLQWLDNYLSKQEVLQIAGE
ncbi:uncharacterized [Tachysurus ichikawai]